MNHRLPFLCSQLSCSQWQAIPLWLPWLSPWKRASQTRRGQWSRVIWERSPESWETPITASSQNHPGLLTQCEFRWLWDRVDLILVVTSVCPRVLKGQTDPQKAELPFGDGLVSLTAVNWCPHFRCWCNLSEHPENTKRAFRSGTHAEDGPGACGHWVGAHPRPLSYSSGCCFLTSHKIMMGHQLTSWFFGVFPTCFG